MICPYCNEEAFNTEVMAASELRQLLWHLQTCDSRGGDSSRNYGLCPCGERCQTNWLDSSLEAHIIANGGDQHLVEAVPLEILQRL